MSARMTDTLPAPDLDDIDVHDWLGRVEVDVNFATHGPTPLATVCAAAVDPLEIAVALEVAGISHAVATGRYNRADVFSIARMLWGQIPLRPTSSAAPVLPRSGDRSDLARGLLLRPAGTDVARIDIGIPPHPRSMGSASGHQLGLGHRPSECLHRLPHAGRRQRQARGHRHAPGPPRRDGSDRGRLDDRRSHLRRRHHRSDRRNRPRHLHGGQRHPADAPRGEVAGSAARPWHCGVDHRARHQRELSVHPVARSHTRSAARSLPSCSVRFVMHACVPVASAPSRVTTCSSHRVTCCTASSAGLPSRSS